MDKRKVKYNHVYSSYNLFLLMTDRNISSGDKVTFIRNSELGYILPMDNLSLNFSDPVSYLESHWAAHGISPGTKWNPKLDFETNWWNGVTIKPESTPMCDRCQNDTKEYSRLRAEMTLSEFTEKHMKCSHYCLWFAWFHRQRQKIGSENIKPVPDKKEVPKTKSKK